jgi:hypothetical protein
MNVAIMQPYFFPYLGYFSLIKHSDLFILLDDVQFIRHGWIDRNRILKPQGGWQYINCPLSKHSRETPIKDIKIRNEEKWKAKILAQLIHYKKKAPFYKETISLLETIFSEEIYNISEFNQKSLISICDYIGFSFSIKKFQELNIKIQPPSQADEWALNICNSIGGVKKYINPIGGQAFFNKQKYYECGIGLFFQNFEKVNYIQKGNVFEPGLSIIDVLMFNNPNDINMMLDKYELI